MTNDVMVSKTPLRQVGSVRELLSNDQARNQLAAVAAKHMTPERMMRLMALAIEKTPKLGECTPMSLLGALMTCAALGLEPNTVMGHAYLIPFKKRGMNGAKDTMEVQLVIGYRGFVQLMWNSGQVSWLDFGVHYSDDPVWSYRKGMGAVIEHEPGPQNGDRLHVYASVGFRNGGSMALCWPWENVIAHRDQYSKGWQDAVRYGKTATSPWLTATDAMGIKTLIRQLAKFVPMSSEIVVAQVIDGGRADYAGFASATISKGDPLASLPMPSTDDVTVEADLVEDDERELAETEEKKPEPQRQEPAKPKADPVAKERVKEAAASLGAAAAKAQADKGKAAVAPTVDKEPAAPPAEVSGEPAAAEEPDYTDFAANVLDDAQHVSVDERQRMLDEFTPGIAKMRAEAPRQYAALEAAVLALGGE